MTGGPGAGPHRSVLHVDELAVGVPLVRRLLRHCMPHLAERPLSTLPSQGSSNALFRLGDDLLVRLPRQPGGSVTIAKEARWLPYLSGALPAAVPEVVALCEPALDYPEQWSIVRWIDGRQPAPLPDGGQPVRGLAGDLAATVAALGKIPVPSTADDDPALRSYRAEPLCALDSTIRGYLSECRELPLDLDLDACERVWIAALALPRASATVEPRWLHGDLIGENLLVDGERLAAVLDFGGLAVGDPVVDLAVAWGVLTRTERAAFHAALEIDDATWLLGRAWALAIALMTFPYYWNSMPRRCAARLVAARAVLEDEADH